MVPVVSMEFQVVCVCVRIYVHMYVVCMYVLI